MAEGLGRDVKAAASALLDTLDLPNNPHTRVAVIGFDDACPVKCPVSSDDGRVRRCIERIGAQGNARLDLGIAEARRQLVAASDDYNESGRDTQRQVTVVFAARPTGDCARSMHEASRLKGLGILLLTACVGEDCDVQCIRSMATSPRYHFIWQDRLRPAQYFRSYNPGFQNVILKRLAIDDHLPGTLQILTDTIQPPTFFDVAAGRLRWAQTHIPKEGVTITVRARTLAVGRQPSTLGATGAFTDNRNRTGSILFPTTPITIVVTTPDLLSGRDGHGSVAAAPTRRAPVKSTCISIAKRTVDPTTMLLGETVDVTMTVTALCAGLSSPLHIVLVVDGSAAMAGDLGRDVRDTAEDLVDRLDLRDSPATRVAVVSFDDRTRVRCPLSNDAVRVTRCIDRVAASGAARLELGLAEARRILRPARSAFPPPYVIREHVVVYAARPAGGCARSLREAERLKADGVQIETVCAGEDCDAPCLQSLATSLRRHFAWRDRAELRHVFVTIRHQIRSILIERLSISDQLSDALVLLTDTVRPAAWQADAATGRVGWTLSDIPRDGVTVTYRARTVRPGNHPVSLGTTGRFTDSLGQFGTFGYEPSYILVLGFDPVTAP